MIDLDIQTLSAILGFLGIVVTAVTGAYVATRNRQTEKEDTAVKALEQTRDDAIQQQMKLRDEKIAYAEQRLADVTLTYKLEVEDLETELESTLTKNKELTVQLDAALKTIQELKGV